MKNYFIKRNAFKCCIALIFWTCFTMTNAQVNNDVESWNMMALKYNVNKKLAFMGDFQLRSSVFFDQFYHIETKFNLFYSLNDCISLVLGIGKFIDYTKDGNFVEPLTGNETRLWEEVFLKKALSRFIFENRSRVEQRFTMDGYKSRIRSRFTLTVPLNNRTLSPNTVFTCFYDDIFNVVNPEINRIYGGMGYKTIFGSLQAGWLHQVKYTSDSKIYLNSLFVLMILEIRNKNA